MQCIIVTMDYGDLLDAYEDSQSEGLVDVDAIPDQQDIRDAKKRFSIYYLKVIVRVLDQLGAVDNNISPEKLAERCRLL